MTRFSTGASRDTGGKGRCDLLPHQALLRVSEHVERSLADHEERDWERGLPMHCMLDSAMRHLFKYMDGRTDEDHLAAATTNLLMAMWTEDHIPEMQDIPTRPEHYEYLSFLRHADLDGGGDSELFGIASHDPGHGNPSYIEVVRACPSETTGGVSESSVTTAPPEYPVSAMKDAGEAPVTSPSQAEYEGFWGEA